MTKRRDRSGRSSVTLKRKRSADSAAARRSRTDRPPPSSGGRNAKVDFRGETRTNATHSSTSDPEAKLYRKGPGMEVRLAFHALMENRHGLGSR